MVKQLPWTDLPVLGLEDLTGLKTGKQANRGKIFRPALAPWTYRPVVHRIDELAPLHCHRVRLEYVDRAKTSRICPACGKESKRIRQGEHFGCIACGYTEDADSRRTSRVRSDLPAT